MTPFSLAFLFGLELLLPTPDGNPQWGDGVEVAVHSEGQYAANLSCLPEDDLLVVWQDDNGDDPDLCAQFISPDGQRLFGKLGQKILRPGIQTNPVVASNTLVFCESQNGEDWTIVAIELSETGLRETKISGDAGGISELQAFITPYGILIAWIQSKDSKRSIESAILKKGVVEPFTICVHDGNIADLQMMMNRELGFWTWTDWRDPLHSHIFIQCRDLQRNEFLFEKNGADLTPTSWKASNARPCESEQGYAAIPYIETQSDLRSEIRFQIIDAQGNFRFWPAIPVQEPIQRLNNMDATGFGENCFIGWNFDDELRSAILDFNGNPHGSAWNQSMSKLRISDLTVAASDHFAWLAWVDNRRDPSLETINVQQFDSNNLSQWDLDGLEVAETDHAKVQPKLLVADPNTCWVSWEDYIAWEENPQVIVQRFD